MDSFSWPLLALVALAIIALICLLYCIEHNPFSYPYSIKKFDVSGKRNVDVEDLIDNYLCDEKNWKALEAHEQKITYWKEETEKKIESHHFKKKRSEQYRNILDDEHAYRFVTTRLQTRYKQQNYQKTAYKVPVSGPEISVSFSWLESRHEKLAEIGFEATLKEFHSKNQRRLMTKERKERIKERDNYTCQICGKHMPDEVGLHIDHIIPVAKGGKSVDSNLRVLCSKCNGKKGAKYDPQ